jgi:hypothetical protein
MRAHVQVQAPASLGAATLAPAWAPVLLQVGLAAGAPVLLLLLLAHCLGHAGRCQACRTPLRPVLPQLLPILSRRTPTAATVNSGV